MNHLTLCYRITFLLAGLWPLKTSAQITLVKDMNTTIVNGSSASRSTVIINDRMVLIMNDGVHGDELWKSDGTIDGTLLLKDVRTGSISSIPRDLTIANDILFFTAAASPTTGRELWKSDGTTAGTVMIKDFAYGSDLDGPIQLTELNGILYFIANNGSPDKPGRELWRTDGSPQGTYIVKETSVVWEGPFGLVKANDKLFFTGYTIDHGRELWVSDGTANGTHELMDINPGNITSGITLLKPYEGGVFFTADDGVHGRELWKSDGTLAGTEMLDDFFPGINPFGVNLVDAACIGMNIYYSIENSVWTSSATDNSSTLLISLEDPNVFPNYFFAFGDKLLFAANDSETQGESLWISDRTTSGTKKLRTINGTGQAYLANMREVAGKIYFSATDGITGTEMWTTDGTTEQTKRVFDLSPGSASSEPNDFIIYRGELFFTAYDRIFGQELFHENGTLVRDVQVRTEGSAATPLYGFQDHLYFQYGADLWRTDGTAEGTSEFIKQLANAQNFLLFNGKMFFTRNDVHQEYQLFESDGTKAGTRLFFQLNNLPHHPPVVHNGSLYFVDADKLYRSDGTIEGTQLIESVPFAQESPIVSSGNYLYLTGDRKLWRSDGTQTGTFVLLSNITPYQLTASNGLVYFYESQPSQTRLWRSDGTEAGTLVIQTFPSGSSYWSNPGMIDVNGTLFFTAAKDASGMKLWKTNGTEQGTVIVKDLRENDIILRPWLMKNVNGTLFFSANGYGNDELWKSDGTSEGTILIKQWEPNHGISSLLAVGDELFFRSGRSSDSRQGIGRSDGTSAGTRTYYLQEQGGTIGDLFLSGNKLYFTFESYLFGRELYVMNLSPENFCRDFSVWSLDGPEKSCEGADIEMSVAVESTNTSLVYTWLKNENVISDKSSKTLTLSNVQADDQGIYQVIVSNGTCSARTNKLEMLTRTVPVVSIPEGIQVNPGDEIRIRLASNPDIFVQGYKIVNRVLPAALNIDSDNGLIDPGLIVGADHLYYDSYTNKSENPEVVKYTVIPISTLGCVGDPADLEITILSGPPEDVVTGTDDPFHSGEINIYPNPVHKFVNITFENPLHHVVQVTICSAIGTVIFKENSTQQLTSLSIDAQNWVPGVYHVVLMDSAGKFFSRKILKL